MLSPVILSFSSVFSLLGTVLVVIAFGTNNWQEFRVNRATLLRQYAQDSDIRPALSGLNQTAIFFDRTLGLFRECFPTDVPNALLMIAAVAVWHGVDYIERELIDRKPFYKTWPSILRRSTDISYGWSYMIAWIGISFILISSVLMLVAHRKMKEEEQREMDSKTVPYIIPSYHEKIMMMPYTHNYYGGYPQQMYGSYGVAPPMTNSYYGYLNYGH